MSTMVSADRDVFLRFWFLFCYQVATPYVNHIATMTGGMGFKDLARFYKVHHTVHH